MRNFHILLERPWNNSYSGIKEEFRSVECSGSNIARSGTEYIKFWLVQSVLSLLILCLGGLKKFLNIRGLSDYFPPFLYVILVWYVQGVIVITHRFNGRREKIPFSIFSILSQYFGYSTPLCLSLNHTCRLTCGSSVLTVCSLFFLAGCSLFFWVPN